MASFGEADKPSISRLIKFSVNLCDRNDKLSDESRERLVFDWQEVSQELPTWEMTFLRETNHIDFCY